jgi:hypothetical protein
MKPIAISRSFKPAHADSGLVGHIDFTLIIIAAGATKPSYSAINI